MKQEYTLHKLPEGFIVTSDEEIKTGDFQLRLDTGKISKFEDINNSKDGFIRKKVIAQQHQIDFSVLSEKEQKEIGYFNIEKLAEFTGKNYQHLDGDVINDHPEYYSGFFDGFQKTQELLSDRRFTLEEVEKAIKFGQLSEKESCNKLFEKRGLVKTEITNQFIQSLSKKSWKIEIEMEYKDGFGYWYDYTDLIRESLKEPFGLRPKVTNGKIKTLKLL
jgi:hypothetical protein